MLNLRIRAQAAEPVKLHQPYAREKGSKVKAKAKAKAAASK
jgi:hypothetical protein